MNNIAQAEFFDIPGFISFGVLNQLPLLRNNNEDSLVILTLLECLFDEFPKGFLVFYEPQPECSDYKEGQSWIEVCSCKSVGDIKLAFDKIGVRYSSYKEFFREEDKFKNKYYCSFYDSNRKQAYYFRNNNILNKLLKPFLGEKTMKEHYLGFYQKFRKQVTQPPEFIEPSGIIENHSQNDTNDFLNIKDTEWKYD